MTYNNVANKEFDSFKKKGKKQQNMRMIPKEEIYEEEIPSILFLAIPRSFSTYLMWSCSHSNKNKRGLQSCDAIGFSDSKCETQLRIQIILLALDSSS